MGPKVFVSTEDDKSAALRGEPWSLTGRDRYAEFLLNRGEQTTLHGFEPNWMPDFLFDFQRHIVEWSIRKGRSAILADCGLGKTPMQLVWAQNVFKKTGKPVLILTPLAVTQQTIRESEKFGISASRSKAGSANDDIVVTNYERLHYFDPGKFGGVVCDESSCLKDFKSATKSAVTSFVKCIPYRLLCTATAAPNDYHELGTSSEVLGELGYRDMITKFFKQQESGGEPGWGRLKYRFREHAKVHFWRWVCSWAIACRRPSDLRFDDDRFELPQLNTNEHLVKASRALDGMLFALPAHGLQEQRQERRQTITERCERVASLVDHSDPVVCWGHLNDECDELEKMIPDAIQVSGKDSDDSKEEKLEAFTAGDERVLVIKPKIGAWGLNWQHCNHVTTFPSHSYEQYYQAVRRCWRFGQTRDVNVDIVTTEGEQRVMKNLQRKSDQADEMFESLVREMSRSVSIDSTETFTGKAEVPSWL